MNINMIFSKEFRGYVLLFCVVLAGFAGWQYYNKSPKEKFPEQTDTVQNDSAKPSEPFQDETEENLKTTNKDGTKKTDWWASLKGWAYKTYIERVFCKPKKPFLEVAKKLKKQSGDLKKEGEREEANDLLSQAKILEDVAKQLEHSMVWCAWDFFKREWKLIVSWLVTVFSFWKFVRWVRR